MDNKIQINTVKPELSFFENETLNRLLDFDKESLLDSKIEDIEKYMENNPGQGLSDQDKDLLYANAQSLLLDFKKELTVVKFNFYLNRPQYNLLTDLLIKKLDYDVNTVFIAIELKNLLNDLQGSKYNNDIELKNFLVTPTELTYIYHLIQTHKVKGLSKEAYTFASLLVRIGESSKIINYYDSFVKNLPEEISQWALRMDSDIVVGQSIPKSESIDA